MCYHLTNPYGGLITLSNKDNKTFDECVHEFMCEVTDFNIFNFIHVIYRVNLTQEIMKRQEKNVEIYEYIKEQIV